MLWRARCCAEVLRRRDALLERCTAVWSGLGLHRWAAGGGRVGGIGGAGVPSGLLPLLPAPCGTLHGGMGSLGVPGAQGMPPQCAARPVHTPAVLATARSAL